MVSARRHLAFGAVTGWWATAARALALVLALAVALPTAGLAEDATYHQGHPGYGWPGPAAVSNLSVGEAQAADPGLACHLHCGCHVVAALDGTVTAPPVAAARPRYGHVADAVPTVFPDRLPRPPRA